MKKKMQTISFMLWLAGVGLLAWADLRVLFGVMFYVWANTLYYHIERGGFE